MVEVERQMHMLVSALVRRVFLAFANVQGASAFVPLQRSREQWQFPDIFVATLLSNAINTDTGGSLEQILG